MGIALLVAPAAQAQHHAAGRLAARALAATRTAGPARARRPTTRRASAFGLDFMGGSEHSDNADLPIVASEDCLDPLVAPQCALADPVNPLDSFRKWDATLEQARAASHPELHRLPRLRVDLGPLRPHQRLLLAATTRTPRPTAATPTMDALLLVAHARRRRSAAARTASPRSTIPARSRLDDERPGLQLERLRLRPGRRRRAWSASRSSTTSDTAPHCGATRGRVRARARQGLARRRGRRRGPRPPPHRRLGRAGLGQDRDPRRRSAPRRRSRRRCSRAASTRSARPACASTSRSTARPMGARIAPAEGQDAADQRERQRPDGDSSSSSRAAARWSRAGPGSLAARRAASAPSAGTSCARDAPGKPIAYSSPVWVTSAAARRRPRRRVAGGRPARAHLLLARRLLPAERRQHRAGRVLHARPERRAALPRGGARGLDYLAITDHNDVRSSADPDFGAYGVIGVPAYENSLHGHAQMLGARRASTTRATARPQR